ncbi:MAG: ABC transporter permease [Ilumatobacteraceae bacterium]
MIAMRLVRLVVTLLVVTFLTSIMFELLPGDPALSLISTDTFNVTPEALEAAREELNLDEPVPLRFAMWLGDAVTGDFGTSFRTRQPVADALWDRIPVTFQLMVMAQAFAIGFALIVAPLAALRPGRAFDRVTTTVSFGLLSVPAFIGALVLIYLVAVKLHWLPSTGFVPLAENPIESIKSLILPALALATPEAAVYTRLLRAEMIATMREDYILMARANGLPTWRILVRHALRPSSFSLLTYAGITIGALIGGSVIVESIFGLPGLGRLAVDAIGNRDFITLQGVVALVTVGFVVVNFLVDLAYYLLDPRLRHAH